MIDFGFMEEVEAKEYPILYERVRDRVKPERAASKRSAYARFWWRFAEPRRELRRALEGLTRYIATLEVSKHRFFTFLDSDVAPDGTLVCIASDDAYHLGVLSSGIHLIWALAAGGRLGVGNDPRNTKSLCFNPFPFPESPPIQQSAIAGVAERLVRHRDEGVARDQHVTMTAMYNVVTKLRSGESLPPAEQAVHSIAACGILRDLHDELDAAVAAAYGWTWPESSEVILERLVALHDQRVEEEKRGQFRWLRPDYQRPLFGVLEAPAPEIPLPSATAPIVAAAADGRPWPKDAMGQIAALRDLVAVGPVSLDEAVQRFPKAKPEIVARHLETLAILGELQRSPDGRYHEVLQPV